MANYVVDKNLLRPYLPAKTELDLWNNECYLSLVGFLFVNTNVWGVRIPFHVNFEEVNLRFYVRHRYENEWRRGVVFIKEICPRVMVSWMANKLYNEHYHTMPMRHTWQQNPDSIEVGYAWKLTRWNSITVMTQNERKSPETGSEAEFILEHYWGYTKTDEQETSEYKVEHPRWEIYPTTSYSIDVDFGKVYGGSFAFLSNEKPKSVFLAEGSEIKVYNGRKI